MGNTAQKPDRTGPALILDSDRSTVSWQSAAIELPDLTFRLLALLMERSPATVSFEDIEAHVWGRQVTRETLKQRIRLLRTALKDIGAPENAIRAIHATGYRFIAPESSAPSSWTGRLRGTPPAVFLALAAALTVMTGTGIWWAASERDAPAMRSPVRILMLDSEAAAGGGPEGDPQSVDLQRALSARLARLQGVETLVALPGTDPAPDGNRSYADYVVDIRLGAPQDSGEREAGLRLIASPGGRLLHTAQYTVSAANGTRIADHFAQDVLTAIRLDRRRAANPRPSTADAAYFRALELFDTPTSTNLDEAIALLDGLEASDAGPFMLALRARIRAERILRHGAPAQEAGQALEDARRAVAAVPELADFRYALARAQLAAGQRADAIETLRSIAPHMPGIERDLDALLTGGE